MKLVGLPIAVANARPEAQEHSVYVTTAHGDPGVARELAEWLLELGGEKKTIFAHYMQTTQKKQITTLRSRALPSYQVTRSPSVLPNLNFRQRSPAPWWLGIQRTMEVRGGVPGMPQDLLTRPYRAIARR